MGKLLFSSIPASSEDEETEETRQMISEVLFSPLSASRTRKRASKPNKAKQKEAIREDDEAYENPQEFNIRPHPPLSCRHPQRVRRVKKIYPVIPVPKDDASYKRKGETREKVAYRGNLNMEMTKGRESDEESLMGVL